MKLGLQVHIYSSASRAVEKFENLYTSDQFLKAAILCNIKNLESTQRSQKTTVYR